MAGLAPTTCAVVVGDENGAAGIDRDPAGRFEFAHRRCGLRVEDAADHDFFERVVRLFGAQRRRARGEGEQS